VACALVGAVLYEWTAMISVFYCCALVLNYHLVILRQWKYKSSWDKIAIGAPIIAATIIVGTTWASGVLGFNGLYCYYKHIGITQETYFLTIFFTWTIWNFLPMVYMVPATFRLVVHLRRTTQDLTHVDGDSDAHSLKTSATAERDATIHRLCYRLIGYVVITLVTYTIPGIGYTILNSPLYFYPRDLNLIINGFSIINYLEGALNGICYFFDPAMVNVYKIALRDLVEWLSKRSDRPSVFLYQMLENFGRKKVQSRNSGKIIRSARSDV